MNISVMGNCNAGVIATCLQVMLKNADVVWVNSRGRPRPKEITGDTNAAETKRKVAARTAAQRADFPGGKWALEEVVASSDIIFCTPEIAPIFNGVAAYSFPSLYFPGFHPDVVYVYSGSSTLVGPMGSNISAITLAGWIGKLTVNQTISIFCEAGYRELGYFAHWDVAKRSLYKQAVKSSVPLPGMVEKWQERGVFMHTPLHPKLRVIAEVARRLADVAGLSCDVRHPEEIMADDLQRRGVWPLYPELAHKIDMDGEYTFTPKQSPALRGRAVTTFSLQEFVEKSYAVYEGLDPEKLKCERLNDSRYLDVVRRAKGAPTKSSDKSSENPYRSLPSFCFWRQAVGDLPREQVDPVVGVGFKIERGQNIATAGSCFAQHISKSLQRDGYNFLVTEPAPETFTKAQAEDSNYGVFSARYGNIYTPRQLLQLYDRAFGKFHPAHNSWQAGDGRYIDPFRPKIEPAGFVSKDELIAARADHLAAVRTMFEKLDVFVFTLGLTEAWRAKSDGAVVPLPPGAAGAASAAQDYEFVNFDIAAVQQDLNDFCDRLKSVNSGAKAILTVSPVPLVATYENRHALVSTTYSKSVLRVAADVVSRKYDWIDYFPSYEIITGSFNRGAYFEKDLRSVTPNGVARVMDIFLKHYSGEEQKTITNPEQKHIDLPLLTTSPHSLEREILAGTKIICEEEDLED